MQLKSFHLRDVPGNPLLSLHLRHQKQLRRGHQLSPFLFSVPIQAILFPSGQSTLHSAFPLLYTIVPHILPEYPQQHIYSEAFRHMYPSTHNGYTLHNGKDSLHNRHKPASGITHPGLPLCSSNPYPVRDTKPQILLPVPNRFRATFPRPAVQENTPNNAG